MSSLESVDCIFQFFGEGPQLAVVEAWLWIFTEPIVKRLPGRNADEPSSDTS